MLRYPLQCFSLNVFPFRRLRFLNLNHTGLSTWDEVDRLALFPSLRSLRVQVSLCTFTI